MARFALIVLALVVLVAPLPAQIQNSSDRARAALVQAVSAMGGSAPASSTASGGITTTAGSLTESGSIVILTRGTDQTSEQIATTGTTISVFSGGTATSVRGADSTPLPLETAVTAQCLDFPLPFIVSVLADPESAYAYIGLETLNGVSVQHIQFWKTFASTPRFGALASFSRRDVWLDASSGLPIRISYRDHSAQGAVAAVPVDITFSNYAKFGNVLYPLSIHKSVNGTPWAAITLTNVVLDNGLTDANFPVD